MDVYVSYAWMALFYLLSCILGYAVLLLIGEADWHRLKTEKRERQVFYAAGLLVLFNIPFWIGRCLAKLRAMFA